MCRTHSFPRWCISLACWCLEKGDRKEDAWNHTRTRSLQEANQPTRGSFGNGLVPFFYHYHPWVYWASPVACLQFVHYGINSLSSASSYSDTRSTCIFVFYLSYPWVYVSSPCRCSCFHIVLDTCLFFMHCLEGTAAFICFYVLCFNVFCFVLCFLFFVFCFSVLLSVFQFFCFLFLCFVFMLCFMFLSFFCFCFHVLCFCVYVSLFLCFMLCVFVLCFICFHVLFRGNSFYLPFPLSCLFWSEKYITFMTLRAVICGAF